MAKKITLLLTLVFVFISISSAYGRDNGLGEGQSIEDMQNIFWKATNGLTPMSMGKDQWALFKIKTKVASGEFQGLGYKAAQVLSANNGLINSGGTEYKTRDLNILITDYKEPVDGNAPEIELQREWACKFVQPPYYLWYSECDLPVEQNFWLFYSLGEPVEPLFFQVAQYTQREKLPQQLIDEGRCYNFENCEIDVNYVEYNLQGKDADGKKKVIHYVTSFSGELPYLASNIKTCYTTNLEINGQDQATEVCQELINFIPGQEAPTE